MENQKLSQASKELAQNLEERKEYKRLMKLEKEIKENKEDQELLEKYKRQQRIIQVSGGINFSDSENNFAELSKEIRNNDTVNSYLEAQRDWENLLEEVFVETGNQLSFDFFGSLGGGCC
ncbi:MAG: YlbF family regulator [Halarsenatibacteraceae bacterium]